MGGEEGEQEWYGYHGKMCRIKIMAQVKWYCQDEFEKVSKHMQTELEIKKIAYLISQTVKKQKKMHCLPTKQYTVIQCNQTVSDNCI